MNETLKKVTGLALWDPTYKATLLYCVPCFNERLTASAAIALGDRVNELLESGDGFVPVSRCNFCGLSVN
jgi:hypothetical protein